MILIKADARHIPLKDETVQCVVTSPPYWGLRDYGLDGKGIGLERTPEEYVANIVQVFREAWRVLREDGTVWLNLGDCYSGSGINDGTKSPGISRAAERGQPKERPTAQKRWACPLKPKDLIGIPWRCAFALQADGWYLRSDIIWAKPNPMPESVRDRPTKAHEYIFLLSKSQRYYYDQEAVREPHQDSAGVERFKGKAGISNGGYEERKWIDRSDGLSRPPMTMSKRKYHPNGRNLRSVWTIATQPFPGAHFATFPEALAERCIKAGTSERGACQKCGAGWKRMVERKPNPSKAANLGEDLSRGAFIGRTANPQTSKGLHRNKGGVYSEVNFLGWSPSCSCDAGDPVPCIVLDPFGGSGTTDRVAFKLGRRAIHLDLGYHELAKTTRCTQIQKEVFA